MLMLLFPPFYTPVLKTGRIMGTPATHGRAAFTGFPLSKSRSFCSVFIKLGEYVGQPYSITSQIPPGTPE